MPAVRAVGWSAQIASRAGQSKGRRRCGDEGADWQGLGLEPRAFGLETDALTSQTTPAARRHLGDPRCSSVVRRSRSGMSRFDVGQHTSRLPPHGSFRRFGFFNGHGIGETRRCGRAADHVANRAFDAFPGFLVDVAPIFECADENLLADTVGEMPAIFSTSRSRWALSITSLMSARG